MIFDLALTAVGGLVSLLVLGLPSGEMPFSDQFDSWAETLAGWLWAFDGLIPIAEQVQVVRWIMVTFFPGWMLFLGVRWVVAHIPFLGLST